MILVLASADRNQVRSHLPDTVENAFFGAFAGRDHQDYGGDANDDTQHAQQSPQLVGSEQLT